MDRLLFTKISYASGHGRAHRQKKVTLNGNEIKETIGPEKEEIFILHSTSIEVVLQLFPKSNHVFIIRKLHTPVLCYKRHFFYCFPNKANKPKFLLLSFSFLRGSLLTPDASLDVGGDPCTTS